MPSLTKTLVSLAVLAALAGCGGSGGGGGSSGGEASSEDESAVRFVMSDLQAAARDGDGDRICNRLFTPKLADSVTAAAESGSCAKEVKANLFSPQVRVVVEDVEVADATNATANVREQDGRVSKILLVKQGGEWRIRSVQPA